jgi:hypothetical protein
MLVFWPFELLLACFILVDWYLWWRRSGADPKEGDASVRRAGAEAVARQMQAGATAAYVLMAIACAIAVMVLYISPAKAVPRDIMVVLFWTVVYCLAAVFLWLWTAGYMASPVVVTQFDVTRCKSVQIGAFAQLLLLLLASMRFVVAIYLLVWRTYADCWIAGTSRSSG